jgi:hypothetical protein
VKFFAYAGTMQEVCLRLMGKKLLVALAMEGKFASEGLQAIDGDDDMLTAMARELVENKGIGESAESVWRQLRPVSSAPVHDEPLDIAIEQTEVDAVGSLPLMIGSVPDCSFAETATISQRSSRKAISSWQLSLF